MLLIFTIFALFNPSEIYLYLNVVLPMALFWRFYGRRQNTISFLGSICLLVGFFVVLWAFGFYWNSVFSDFFIWLSDNLFSWLSPDVFFSCYVFVLEVAFFAAGRFLYTRFKGEQVIKK